MASTTRVGIDRGTDLPKIEVRYDHLSVEGQVHAGSRATPSLPNFFLSIIELPWRLLGFSKKIKVNILSDVSGILKPSRLTLLLGPPESGRTTLLRALAGRLSTDLHVSGEITYNGHHLKEFVPRKTSAYVGQYDLQTAELTVKETLDFYSRVQGVTPRYVDMLEQLARIEKDGGSKPEADVDLKTIAMADQSPDLLTDYTVKLMGLDICANTRIGDAMRRGISGGQKKRVSTAEMLVGPAKAFFMDEISTGLDSSTTFQLTKMLQQIVHLMDSTIMVSLLQPAPETYALFDDVILLADGQIVYQGPCGSVLEFMAYMGFKCPERKAVADFLQEVTSRKDQRQYWANNAVANNAVRYQYVTVPTFVEGFKQFHVGQRLAEELAVPYDKSESHTAALVYKKYALNTRELLRACFARELVLMKRNMPTYIVKVLQIAFVGSITATLYLRTTLHHDTLDEATVYQGALFFGLVFIMLAGLPELTFTSIRLPVFYKEKELFLYPAWAISIPMFVLRIPWSILEAGTYVVIVYFVIGFSPEPGRFFRQFLVLILINQATIAMFRFAAVVARVRVAAENLGSALFSCSILLGGFVLSKDDMPVWWKWATWCSDLFYGQEASSVNEFLSKEWNKPFGDSTLGVAAIRSRGLESEGYWVWLSIGVLMGFTILFFLLFTLALHYINPPTIVRSTSEKSREASVAASVAASARTSRQTSTRGSLSRRSGLKGVLEIQSPTAHLSSSPKLARSSSRRGSMSQRRLKELQEISSPRGSISQRIVKGVQEILSSSARLSGYSNLESERDNDMFSKQMGEPRLSANFDDGAVHVPMWCDFDRIPEGARGMVLPFQPLSISFENINYSVDMPDTMKQQGVTDDKLQLLNDVSGGFRPGVLTALVGVTGAGKTTLLDVLAGRKTRGYIEGEIFISGYPKRQSTFTRVAGYCEQNDIHSPNITVFESLVFSAWMRLAPEVHKQTRMTFVEEVMGLVELDGLRDFVVGLPGQSGLSTEQRKRLTIAVELVANPSIIFMDEPTSGLDARAAAIVMRAVRNIGDTGRTVVCTIHQPSIDIFEAFDELLLLKNGGKTIYGGPLGRRSQDLVDYFQAIPGVPKIKDGYNPAAWMLDVSSPSMESNLGVNFAEIYANSPTYQKNLAMIRKLRTPAPGSKDLEFSTVYAQSFWVQCRACFWKMGVSYWRNPLYTGVKVLFVIFMSLLFGSLFWNLGRKRGTEQEVFNLFGAFYCIVIFVGFGYTMAVQPIIGSERIVYYRERGAGLYSPLTYAVAQFFIEWPYAVFNSIIFTAITYSMIEFDWKYDKVLWFFFFVLFNVLFFVNWGMIAVSATPNPQLAAILGTFPFSLLSVFSGFPIARKQMPVWWRWLYWCNPMAWSVYGFAGSQLGDVTSIVAIPDNPDQKINVKEFIRSYYGIEHSFLKFVAIEQVALALSLGFVFALCIKHCNFQRR